MPYNALLINWRDAMQNLKIKVNSAEESKEVQELFFKLGGVPHKDNQNKVGLVILADNTACADFSHFEDLYTRTYSLKEITIPQLKDMVVLKRNNVGDATHGVVGGDGKYYLTPSSFYEYINGYWECVDEYVNGLEFFKLNNNDLPFIDSEKDMKEYLEPMPNGDYRYHIDDGFSIGGDWIEIPEGADVYSVIGLKHFTFSFYRNNFSEYYNSSTNMEWRRSICELSESRGFKVLWQHHQQEESLNDKVASAEEARQANKTVQDTLDERQKQYGCFEDVAYVTQGMVDLMRKCGYDRMPQTHQMSLYMICSKMARIVNGNFNHVDSWHDISGYAQLVEKLVKE